jgi:Protein of unknown function (DUF3300)
MPNGLLEGRSMNLRFTTLTAVVALMLFTPIADYAQDLPATPPGTVASPAVLPPAPSSTVAPSAALLPAPPGTVAPSAVDTKSTTYSQQKLDQMLAPIALYPDQLMSQI